MTKEQQLPDDIVERLNQPYPDREYWIDVVNELLSYGDWDEQLEQLKQAGALGGALEDYPKDLS